ncbi:MAG: hypothetical protein ACODAD_01325 [Planctomycetota bacterium]
MGIMHNQLSWAWLVMFCSPVVGIRMAWGQTEAPSRQAAGESRVQGTAGENNVNLPRGAASLPRLDAPRFKERNDATRQLLARGPQCVPLLVTLLGAESREVQFRAAQMLRRHFDFDQIAPHLAAAVEKPYGLQARKILRDRALLQVSNVAEMDNTRKLLAFWRTDIESLQRRVMFDLPEVRQRKNVLAVVAPLVGLTEKAGLFNQSLSSLKSLDLHYDHRHSPGYIVAETLAEGLLQSDKRKTSFAHDYIQAFETLVAQMRAEGSGDSAIRKEVLDRANMSDGATSFLVRLLDTDTKQYQLLTVRLEVDAEALEEGFFHGLAHLDSKTCYRCVGKVHIADMLVDSLDQRPPGVEEQVVQDLTEQLVLTLSSGDKPKALALLDAMEGCFELESSHASLESGLRRKLSHRLRSAALAASNNRVYHPARAVHDRILKILDTGVKRESELFPNEFLERYLSAAEGSTSDDSRLALGRYMRILEKLREAGLDYDQPGVRQFLRLMRRELDDGSTTLEKGVAEVWRLARETEALAAKKRRRQMNQGLGKWSRAVAEPELVTDRPEKGS